jgi:hypothetical protein
MFCFCLWEVPVAYHFSFLCCVLCFCLWGVGRVGVHVACHFSFLCCVDTHHPDPPQTKHTTQKTKITSNTDPPSEPPQTKTKHTTQKTKMTSNTDTHPPDPPQTKTKHTTQKTKMGSLLLIILVFCLVCFVFVLGDLCCLSF